MQKNKLNLKSEGFKLHYLSLNLQFNNLRRIKFLANYLSYTFGCNSVYVDCKDLTKNCTLVKTKKNSWTVKFRVNSQDYWSGTVLNFSGNQATHFYKMIQERKLSPDWEAFDFDDTSLSRIDVCYDRKLKKSDKVELFDSFGKKCEKQIEKAIFKNGVIRVGKRGGGNYFRAYRRENGKEIRFELELSKSVVKKFQFYLFSNQFEKLEELLCMQFYKQGLTSFVRDSIYTDWLRENFRNIRASEQYENSLITTYLKNLSLETLEKQELLKLLAELEKPFFYSAFDGMEALSSQDILRLPEAESFGLMPNPSLSPYQQRAKTHVLSAQTKNDVVFVAKDGRVSVLKDKSTNHLLSKHGDSLGIDDPLPPNPNQKSKEYNQIRTRINKKNKQQFAGILEKILQDPKTEVFPDVSIRGITGQVYYTEDYGGFLIGIHTEGEFAGQIMKAQPVTPEQLEILKTLNSID